MTKQQNRNTPGLSRPPSPPTARTGLVRLTCALAVAMQIRPGAGLAAERVVATEEYRVRIVSVATGLQIPWGMTFLDRERILLTEKPGRMRIVEGGRLLPQPVAGLPPVRVRGQGGQVIVRLILDGDTVVREERIKGTGRTRDIRAGPDGNLYVLSETEGVLLRIEPVN